MNEEEGYTFSAKSSQGELSEANNERLTAYIISLFFLFPKTPVRAPILSMSWGRKGQVVKRGFTIFLPPHLCVYLLILPLSLGLPSELPLKLGTSVWLAQFV